MQHVGVVAEVVGDLIGYAKIVEPHVRKLQQALKCIGREVIADLQCRRRSIA
jgi:hypothetical protein